MAHYAFKESLNGKETMGIALFLVCALLVSIEDILGEQVESDAGAMPAWLALVIALSVPFTFTLRMLSVRTFTTKF